MERVFSLPAKYRTWAWVFIGAGALATALGFVVAPVNVWVSLQVSSFYFISAALFGGFILAVASVSGAAWLTPYKSVAEAMTAFLLPGGVLLVLVFLGGGHTLFEWTHTSATGGHGGALSEKQAYLNVPFFLGRMLVFLGLWILSSKVLVALSRQPTTHSSIDGLGRQVRASVVFLILFAFTYSFASFDWMMSVEPHWSSTIFGLYSFSGFFVAGAAILTIAVIALEKFGYLSGVVNENHYHDLGKLLFAFSTFWAYMWVSQYLLIWYTNLPEEIPYYELRTHHDWDWLFYFNLVLNWVIPFFVLMPRGMKRSREMLLRVCIVLLVGRWLDLFLLISPKVFEVAKVKGPSIGWIELGIGLGIGGVFILASAASLARSRIVPREDAFFEESVHLTQ